MLTGEVVGTVALLELVVFEDGHQQRRIRLDKTFECSVFLLLGLEVVAVEVGRLLLNHF